MLHSRLTLGLLLTAPFAGFAQTPEAAPAATPRFYVGLAAYHSNFQNLGSWRQGDTGFRVPVQLTAGYQLRPRLALELGAAYSGRSGEYAYDGYYYGGSTLPARYAYSETFTTRTTTLTALARYTLTRKPAHRLQFDALGGLSLVHRSYYNRGFQGDDLSGTFETMPFSSRRSYNDLLLTAGLGVRYRLTSRLGLNFDITTNYDLTRPDSFDQFTGSAALGLRYRFGK